MREVCEAITGYIYNFEIYAAEEKELEKIIMSVISLTYVHMCT